MKRNFLDFSNSVQNSFENKSENMDKFILLMKNASQRIYDKYSEKETQNMIREQFNQILGIDYASASKMERRQARRLHAPSIYTLIETVVADKMNSGWTKANAQFLRYVEDVNLSETDQAMFYVKDPSLLTVSKYAGNHHDIVRQRVREGKGFTIDTSRYVIKVYTDFELFQLGKVDFAEMVDRMYQSIEQYRMAALFTAFMSMDSSLPTDMKTSVAFSAATIPDIIDQIDAVKAATGDDVLLVGTRPAIQRLQNTVNYNMWSGNMKDELNQNGLLANFYGYDVLPLDRVNLPGTRTSVFSTADNKKIFIMPVSADFRPIKRVNSGDVTYNERGFDGQMQDMTVEAELWYEEGIGVVINELFGLIEDTNP